MRRKISLHVLLFIPLLLGIIFENSVRGNGGLSDPGILAIIIASYNISLAGIVLFIKFKPFNAWWLPLGFMLSPIPMYIYETGQTGLILFAYLGTWIVILFYTIPFVFASIIIAAAFSVLAYKRRR